jgi:transcriptional regulator with XRE-family HTH domain
MTDSVHTAKYHRFREILIEAREAKQVSQVALAQKLGWVQTAISKYERGERRLDVIEFLEVAEALGIDPHKVIRQLADTEVH